MNEQIKDFVQRIFISYYEQHDNQAVIDTLDSDILWIGPGYDQTAVGKTEVSKRFTDLIHKTPVCSVQPQSCTVIPAEKGSRAWVFAGSFLLFTNRGESSETAFIHRLTAVVRETPDGFRFRHIHNSIETETKRSTELLIRNDIYESLPVGIIRLCITGTQAQLISVNQKALSLCDVDDTEKNRQDLFCLMLSRIHPADLSRIKNRYQVLTRAGQFEKNEYRVLFKDGSEHWISSDARVISASGESVILQLTLLDITEQKQAQAEQQYQTEIYRLAFESMRDCIYEYQIQKDVLTAYRPIKQADGTITLKRAEISNYSHRIKNGDVVVPECISDAMQVVCYGTLSSAEVRIYNNLDKNNPEWHTVTGRIQYRGGQPERIVGYILNIEKEKQLSEKRTKDIFIYRSALQAVANIFDAIYHVDLDQDTMVLIQSQGTDKTYNIQTPGTYSQIAKAYTENFIHPQDRKRILNYISIEQLQRLITPEEPIASIEYQRIQPESEDTDWVRITMTALSFHDGKPSQVILAIRNTSSERNAEREQLEQEVKARELLQEAFQSVQQANNAKMDFLSRMSHDIRTPMNAIIGMTMIAENNLNDASRIHDCLTKIHTASVHLLGLINEILDMSKIDRGKMILHTESFSLQQIIDNITSMIIPQAEIRHLHFNVNMDAVQHPYVIADITRIQQILLNLISNSIKYTQPNGHISLTIQEYPANAASVSCYKFIVADTGIGMDTDFISRIFQPFERAEDSRVSKIQGTGLGLAISQHIAHLMDGEIAVESTLNKGSVFTVTLYLQYQENAPDLCRQEPHLKDFGDTFSGKHILLVEDNDLNLEIISEILHSLYITTTPAANGAEAVNKYCAAPQAFDLIFMDIQMPIMNGFEATKRIREFEKTCGRHIPIIALTANAFAEDVHMALISGMDSHLAKPIDIAQLRCILSRYLLHP